VPTRILIAEDEQAIRALLREYLASDSTFEIVAETPDGSEAVRLAEQHRPDIVLMDLSLEGMDGLRATKEIKKSCPATEVIILTGYGFEDLKERARESPQLLQSSAFLGKHQIPTDLLPVMRALAKGRSKKT
jgi:NarL family two-component system response regulator LiaR